MPLMSRPWIAPDDGRAHLSANLFGVRASRSYNTMGDEVPLPDIFGSFDLGVLADATTDIGAENPLKTEWQGLQIPWFTEGKLQGQGLDIEWQYPLHDYVWIGGSCMAMRLHSWYNFLLNEKDLNVALKSDKQELEDLRREILNKLGFCGDHAYAHGIGDMELYLRFGNYWQYALKFRSIQAGGRIGVLVPTAKARNIHYPASIPFGGNRHWGLYGAVDAIFELKEDLKVGLYTRLSKRFSRIDCERIPVRCEPDNFGVLQGRVKVNPGVTFVFSPFVSFECLRDGLGARVFYTFTKHWKDKWTSCHSEYKSNLKKLCNRTSWGSDYFSVNVFYDFGKAKPDCAVYPILTFCWDIPTSVLIAHTVAKTDRVSLGVEVSF